MPRLLSLLAALLAAEAALAAQDAPQALTAVATDLGRAVGPPQDGRRSLALRVETRAKPLAAPLETALSAALAQLGYSVTPLPPEADAEAAARSGGQDWLVRVQAGLVPGRPEIALVGEVVPTWESFFLQRSPRARPVPPRLVQARRPADPETLLLGRESRPPDAPFARLVPLARIDGEVLALAAGDAGFGPAIAAVTPEAVLLLSSKGEVLARRELDRSSYRPVRSLSAAIAIGDFGGGRLAVEVAGANSALVLARRGDRLEPVATLDAAPLCASETVRLFGVFAPGKGLFLDELSPAIDPGARPRSNRELYGVAALPHGGRIAFAALDTDLSLDLLGPDLLPSSPSVVGVGVGFALADLQGDGEAEIVASLPSAGGLDKVRVIATRAEHTVLFESESLRGSILAAAAADLTGDGVDDAVLALVSKDENGSTSSQLLLLTSDPRGQP